MSQDMMEQDAPEPAGADVESPEHEQAEAKKKAVHDRLKGEIGLAKSRRKDLIPDWRVNVDARRGKVAIEDDDETRDPLSLDWSLTKQKEAQLFSQLPTVVVTGQSQNESIYQKAAPVFGKRLNMWLDAEHTHFAATMTEVLADVINAAGIGAVIVAHETRQAMRTVPVKTPDLYTPEEAAAAAAGTWQPEMVTVPDVTDARFTITRISPADLLLPPTFKLSNFNRAPWIGYSGRKPWAEAKGLFRLTDDEKQKVCGDQRTPMDRLTNGEDRWRSESATTDMVAFDEVYYWRYLYHEDEPTFTRLQRVVFVSGKDEPVIDEEWRGQVFDPESNRVLGSQIPPVQVLTLAYLSDDPIPPSDTAMGRPQILDLMESRTQAKLQRKHATPMRWHDVNRIDPETQSLLQRGDFQGSVPVNGDGQRVLGEVARANYPQENFQFDRMMRADLQEMWQMGPNQSGAMNASGEHSAAETKTAESHFQTRIGLERDKVARFFLSTVQVLAGLMALYDTIPEPAMSQEDRARLAVWDARHVPHHLAFEIRPDATVRLDVGQRLERATKALDMLAKSGYLKVKEMATEIVALMGFDPERFLDDPAPKGPEPPNMSFRLSGVQDLLNPIALAMLMKSGQAPTPDELKAAMLLLTQANGAAMLQEPDPNAPPPGGNVPEQDLMPDYTMADRINRRREPGA